MAERGGDRDAGGDAVEHQQRRQQEAAAHAEQAGKKSHAKAHAQNDDPMDRHFRDGQVDFHGPCPPAIEQSRTPPRRRNVRARCSMGQPREIARRASAVNQFAEYRRFGRHIGDAVERRGTESLRPSLLRRGAVGVGQLGLQHVEARLGFRVARAGCDGIPFIGVEQALRHAVAALIQHREIELGIRKAQRGGLGEPARRFRHVLLAGRAVRHRRRPDCASPCGCPDWRRLDTICAAVAGLAVDALAALIHRAQAILRHGLAVRRPPFPAISRLALDRRRCPDRRDI